MKTLFILSTLLLLGSGCIPKCIKSHTESFYHAPEPTYTWVKGFWTGLPKQVQTGITEGYTETWTVCDEYAPSK